MTDASPPSAPAAAPLPAPPPAPRPRPGPAFAIFVTVAAVVLLLGSRERPWGDAQVMYEAGESLANHGSVAVRWEWPPMSRKGPDGRVYSIYGLAASVVSVPGVWLRSAATAAWPSSGPLAFALTSHLAHALLGALACVLFYRMARRHGASARAASFATAVLAFGTSIFVYARYPFSEVVQVAAFTGLLDATLAAADRPDVRRGAWVGLWAGFLVNAKAIFALSLVGTAVFLLAVVWRDRRALVRLAIGGLAAFAPLLGLWLAYNHVRWGGPLTTGYEVIYAQVREHVWVGLYGFLLSPGKGLLLFSPPLVAAAVAWPRFAREQRRAALAFALLALPPLLYYARVLSWSGDYCWGPRYIAYLIPGAMLPLAPLLDRVAGPPRRRAALAGIALAAGLGVLVQLVGSAFYWDHWIRVMRDASTQWLGKPNRKGAAIAEAGRGHCDACFEDMHPLVWLPPFGAIEGHVWLLRHVPAGHDWKRAEQDAPWRRYTTLNLNIKDSYARARVDWWGLLWIKDHRGLKVGGGVLLALMLGAAGGGAFLWVRRTRGGDGS